jgi:Secretion system C-terminal sorting domain
MKRFPLLLLALLTITGIISAQPVNLIGNGDFETVAPLPTGQGQIALASGWSNCNGNTTWPYGSPDLFHTGATGNVQLPSTVAGTVTAHSGNAVAGLITSNGLVADFREYISYQLATPLVAGQSYTVEFWLTSGASNWYGNRGSNGIGAAFTMAQPVQVLHEPLMLTPQVEITTVIRHNDWRRYSFTFTPTQAFQFITIGNFRNDLNTTWSVYSGTNNIAYYFIDLASVVISSPLDAETVNLRQTENTEAIELAWHVPADAATDQFILERSLDQSSFETVKDFGMGMSADAEIQHIDTEALPGLKYYYRLRDIGINGDLKFSPTIEATYGSAVKYVAGNVYPNPVQDQFSLAFTPAANGLLSMDLIDATGRIVLHEDRDLVVGDTDPNYITPSDLAVGIYQARFQFAGETFTKKVIVTERL